MNEYDNDIKLTEKQKLFCDYYLIDLNATQAAIKAGYSKKTARFIGNENLTKPYIQEYIKKRMEEKENDLIASQDEVLKYLTRVMRREEMESAVVVTKTKTTKSIYNEDTKRYDKETIEEENPEVVEFPTKVSDSNKAAELLGRRYGIFKDNVNLEGNVPIVIVDDMEEDDEE